MFEYSKNVVYKIVNKNILSSTESYIALIFICLFSWEVTAATVVSSDSITGGNLMPIDTLPLSGSPPVVADPVNKVIARALNAKMAGSKAGQKFQVIVMLSTPGKAASFQKSVGNFQIHNEFSIFSGFAATMTQAQIQALSAMNGVFKIEEDAKVKAHIDDVRADFGIDHASNNLGTSLSGAGIGICIIDSGVNINHQQTDQNITEFCNALPSASNPCDVDALGNAITDGTIGALAFDDFGHGTAVLSVAAGDGQPNSTYKGVAPDAHFAVAKVLDSNGVGSTSGVIKGLEWCAGLNNMDIGNMSLGHVESTPETDALTFAANCVADPGWSTGSPVMTCAYPGRSAMVVVTSAGNTGPAQEQIFSPGEAEQIITVAASYNITHGGNTLAAFSSTGPTWNGLIKPDITAPGIAVRAADALNGNTAYSEVSGTSFSSPVVAGVIALMLEADPSLTPSEIKDIIRVTAEDIGAPGKDNYWGWGMLDPPAAVNSALGNAGGNGFNHVAHGFLTGHLDPGEPFWEHPFQVDDPNLPIAVTMRIGGTWKCIWEVLPLFGLNCSNNPAKGGSVGVELDMELRNPGGSVIDLSACSHDPDTLCGGPTSLDVPLYGTQGALESFTESAPAGGFSTGFYAIRVVRAPDPTGAFDDTQSVDFTLVTQNTGGSSSNLSPETDDVAASGFDNELIQVDLTGNDDGTVDFFVVTSLPGNGILYLNSNGTGPVAQDVDFSASPANSGQRSVYFDPSAAGITSFDYAAIDDQGVEDMSPAIATLTINPSGTGGNNPPVSAFTWGCDGTSCSFISGSSDPDGDSLSYAWDFGDGTTSTFMDPSRTYRKQGSYTVSLTVNDGQSSTSISTVVNVTRKNITSGGTSGPDVTPPLEPAGVIAIAGNGSVSLDWNDNGEADLSSYSVYRSTVSGGPYSEVANGLASSAYNDSGLTNGITYYYEVSAFDTSNNESPPSTEVFATPTGGGGGTATSVHINSITVSTVSAGKGAKRGQAQVTILDDLGNPVINALVNGIFSGTISGSDSDITNSSGFAVLTTGDTAKGSVLLNFCVDNVVASLPYNSGANAETCDSN